MVYVAKEKVFTGSFTIQRFKLAISISIILHLFVVLLLIITTDEPINNFPKKLKVKPIKSFIYYKPTEVIKEKIATNRLNDEKKKEQNEKSPLKEEVQLADKEAKDKNTKNKPKIQSKQPADLIKTPVSPLKVQQKKSIKNVSSLQRLSRLKDKINQKIINQEMYNYSKPNTGSVMHGTPSYVPHSIVENAEKKAIASTPSQVGNGFSITKDNNGTCTLTEDLSIIGLQGKTTSSFGCGLSKEEKHFKNHMKNVLKKLGK
jgi:hypothetical protein